MSPMVKLPLTLEHALLGFLSRRPMHAYEMYQTLQQARELGLVWHLKQSQLYVVLARLEEAGYITAFTQAQGTRPPRRIMSLTSSGHDAFRRWLLTPVRHGRDFRQEFLAKLYFAQAEDPAGLAALVDGQREVCQSWLADFESRIDTIADERVYDRLVLQFRAGQVRAILEWLDTCKATVADAPLATR
ncbi:MAG TPA: PadR family transcriptional regulator [Herpetosiphonaceae bacterium]|nr:PadR family transcriptional regulator [Herpetosiphonaceae bacterium]